MKKQKQIKQKKGWLNRILSPIVVFLFLLLLLILMNFDTICRVSNKAVYEKTEAEVVQRTTDKILMLIPMVDIRYQYEGKEYEETKYFVLQPLFGLSAEKGNTLTIYVNKNAPNHSLFKVNFFTNIINILLLILEIVCVYNIQKRIRKIDLKKEGRADEGEITIQ